MGSDSLALRAQALLEFGLPAAPPRLAELGRLPSGGEAVRLLSPSGPWLLLVSAGQPLQLAFEATLFDLLAEARYPAARPRRSRGGALIARLASGNGPAAATCYPWLPGEQ